MKFYYDDEGGIQVSLEALAAICGTTCKNVKDYLNLAGEDHHIIICPKMCAKAVLYFAFLSKMSNTSKARAVLKSLLVRGVECQVEEIMDCDSDHEVWQSLEKLLCESDLASKFEVCRHPDMVSFSSRDYIDTPVPIVGNKGVTTTEWLASKDIRLTKSGVQSFGRLVTSIYNERGLPPPVRGTRKNITGAYSSNMKLYFEADYSVLEEALKRFSIN